MSQPFATSTEATETGSKRSSLSGSVKLRGISIGLSCCETPRRISSFAVASAPGTLEPT